MKNMIKMNSMSKKKSSDDPFYGSTKVGSRGQVVLPMDIRKKLDIKEGDILFVCESSGHIKVMKGEVVKRVLEEIE